MTQVFVVCRTAPAKSGLLIRSSKKQDVREKEQNEACEQALQEGDLKAVERELARGVGAEELGIALMWACSSGQVCSQ